MHDTAKGWFCPQCKEISPKLVELFDPNIKEYRHGLKSIHPVCRECLMELSYEWDGGNRQDRKVLILTGTCASGKSTIAQILSQDYGFFAIDGDGVRQIVKLKTTHVKPDWNAPYFHSEILTMIDMLLSLNRDVAIAHVVLPDSMPLYRAFLSKRGVNYRFFVLRPDCDVLVTRNQSRECWTTEERWIHELNSPFFDLEHNHDLFVYDNSNEGPEQSASRILELVE